jgi:hypothetical protein
MKESQISKKVPAVAKHRLAVCPGDIRVLGYLGDRVDAVVNATGGTVEFTLAVSSRDSRRLTLRHDECYAVSIDVYDCMRDRFMPYITVCPEAPTSVKLDVVWVYG